ncbi:MAG: hypothetical protein EOP85_18550 [Verrucomicrobiaceae bacterium]|nr:MAG: hypothetical protein EOP85_18550 [Verrucomicrobiaceae bacterium]
MTVLVSVTSIALDTWNRSRAELRASRQAKAMLDVMSRDFESLVVRSGNNFQWLSALASSPVGDPKLQSTNASELIFFTAVTDRYNGDLGADSTSDRGGDISCVSYKLAYKDPVDGGGSSDFETFVLNRLVVNPDETFDDLLAREDLETAFRTYDAELSSPENFVCENVFQFSVTFHIQVTQKNASGDVTGVVMVPVTVGKNAQTEEFRVYGTGIDTDVSGTSVSASELAAGRLTALEISVTVISDFGIDQVKRRSMNDSQKAEFLAGNSYQYTKKVQLPSM